MEQARISPSSSSQGAQSAHAARGKSAAQDAAGTEGAAGGFLALLAALGDGGQDELALLPDGALATQADPPALAQTQDGAGVQGVLAAWQGLLAPVAQGVYGEPQGLVAETTMLDTAVDAQGGPVPSSAMASGAARALSRMQGALAQRADAADTPSTVGRAGVGDAARQASVPPHAAAATTAVQMVGDRAVPGASHADRASAGAAFVEASAPLADGLLAAVASAQGGEAGAAGPRSGEGRAGAGTPYGDAMAEAPQEPVSPDAATAAVADPTQASAEDQIAEQVAYWVHQKTQNAELTLQRDGQPVEVSVSLSGNEAHVAFRSDQAQTRELLDQGMAQLRELLRGEGLVLSGMSVGTSAGQGSGGNAADGQRQREGARQGQVVAAVPAGTGAVPRPGGATDRTVDVFV
ncbi:MAG: flagellar hook-length control protein FliK [Acidovorax sp.]|uniref:flagellar hook-length control protein FliK n=1 Tax=Acidovorax sp. TaxID=1872122 RepID=UPI0039E540C7